LVRKQEKRKILDRCMRRWLKTCKTYLRYIRCVIVNWIKLA
jgi:hypothetical protein